MVKQAFILMLVAMVIIPSTESRIVLEVLLKTIETPRTSALPRGNAQQHNKDKCAHNIHMRLHQDKHLQEVKFVAYQFTKSTTLDIPEFLTQTTTNPVSMLLQPLTERQVIMLEVTSTNEKRNNCLADSHFRKPVTLSTPISQNQAKSRWQSLKVGAIGTNLNHRRELVAFTRSYCSKGTYGSSCQHVRDCHIENSKCLTDDPCIIVETNPLVNLDQTPMEEGFQMLLVLRLAKLNLKVISPEDLTCTIYIDRLELNNKKPGLAISMEARYKELPVSGELVFQALVDMLLSGWLNLTANDAVVSGRDQSSKSRYHYLLHSLLQNEMICKTSLLEFGGMCHKTTYTDSGYFLMGAFWFIVALAVLLSAVLAHLLHQRKVQSRRAFPDYSHQAMIDTDIQTTFTEY